MKRNKLAIAAILLWLATIAVFAVFFIRGNTTAGTDNRTAVMLATGERELILSEMRSLLASVQGILEGLSRNDMKQLADAARAVGMSAAADVNPALMAKLPLSFKQLGMSVHSDMDDLAQAAESGKPAAELQGTVANILSKCIACHAAWQLKTNE